MPPKLKDGTQGSTNMLGATFKESEHTRNADRGSEIRILLLLPTSWESTAEVAPFLCSALVGAVVSYMLWPDAGKLPRAAYVGRDRDMPDAIRV